MTDLPQDALRELAPVERDESYQRDYIPIPGVKRTWEVQTKGKGSTARLAWHEVGGHQNDRTPIPCRYLQEDLTAMAYDVREYVTTLQSELAALRQRCELLEANLHVQGEYLAGALADVERVSEAKYREAIIDAEAFLVVMYGDLNGDVPETVKNALGFPLRLGRLVANLRAVLDPDAAIAANTTPQRAPEDQT